MFIHNCKRVNLSLLVTQQSYPKRFITRSNDFTVSTIFLFSTTFIEGHRNWDIVRRSKSSPDKGWAATNKILIWIYPKAFSEVIREPKFSQQEGAFWDGIQFCFPASNPPEGSGIICQCLKSCVFQWTRHK